MKSKTLILSSPKKIVNNSPRAILTFISDNKNIEGKLRLYNLDILHLFEILKFWKLNKF